MNGFQRPYLIIWRLGCSSSNQTTKKQLTRPAEIAQFTRATRPQPPCFSKDQERTGVQFFVVLFRWLHTPPDCSITHMLFCLAHAGCTKLDSLYIISAECSVSEGSRRPRLLCRYDSGQKSRRIRRQLNRDGSLVRTLKGNECDRRVNYTVLENKSMLAMRFFQF
jgi:hypothetical protein